MEVDLDKTRVCKKSVEAFLRDKAPADRLGSIGELAATLMCPIIAIGCYVGELYGMTEELDGMIRSWMTFYKVERIVGYQGEHNVPSLPCQELPEALQTRDADVPQPLANGPQGAPESSLENLPPRTV